MIGTPPPDDPLYSILSELATRTGLVMGESELPAVVALYREYLAYARDLDAVTLPLETDAPLGFDLSAWLAAHG